VAALSLSTPLFTYDYTLRVIGFCVFEVTVGVFWPAVGTLRGSVVPESIRATVMNIFRVPLNVLVVAILTHGTLSGSTPFTYCLLWTLVAAGSASGLRYLMVSASKEERDPASGELLDSAL